MFKQGLGRKTKKGKFYTLFAEYSEDGTERVFVLETRAADRPDCPGENRYTSRPIRKTLSENEALAFLKEKDMILSASGKEALIGKPNDQPLLIIQPGCSQGWRDRVVPGWATHVKKKGVRDSETGWPMTQYLADFLGKK